MDFISGLFLLGIGQGLFLAFALLTTSKQRLANTLLGLLCLVFSLDALHAYLALTLPSPSKLWLLIVTWPREFLYGVLIYFYTLSLTKPAQLTLSFRNGVQLVPALTHAAITWPLLLYDYESTLNILRSSSNLEGFYPVLAAYFLNSPETALGIIHVGIYLLLSLHLIRSHQKTVSLTCSYKEKIDLQWLKVLLRALIALYLIWLADFVISDIFKIDSNIDILLTLSIIAVVYAIGFYGYKQPAIFGNSDHKMPLELSDQSAPDQTNDISGTLSSQNKYARSALTSELSKTVFEEVEILMCEKRAYRNSTLTLNSLADMLNISRHYLSQAINENAQCSFYDYINAKRVAQVTDIIENDKYERLNFLQLSLDAGFNSKSAFYAAFKKHTRMTPKAYQDQRRKQHLQLPSTTTTGH